LRQRQLAVIGKVLASFAQDMQDRLATIRESDGWLGDLLGQAGHGTEEDRGRFGEILSTIERQVKVLDRKSEDLSRLAQRMGTGLCTFDPGEIVEEAVTLSSRSAHLREVSLRPEVAETLPSLYSDPVRVHFLVLILINDMLERTGRGGKVIVRAGSVEKSVLIEIEGSGTLEAVAPPEEGNQYWSIGQQVVADLGGRLQTTAIGRDKNRTSMILPIKQMPSTSEM
jgi:hypothetical protein